MKKHFKQLKTLTFTGMIIDTFQTDAQLGEVTTIILSTLAYAIIPIIHGQLQEDVINTEFEFQKKNGFLTSFINNNSNLNIDKRLDFFHPLNIRS